MVEIESNLEYPNEAHLKRCVRAIEINALKMGNLQYLKEQLEIEKETFLEVVGEQDIASLILIINKFRVIAEEKIAIAVWGTLLRQITIKFLYSDYGVKMNYTSIRSSKVDLIKIYELVVSLVGVESRAIVVKHISSYLLNDICFKIAKLIQTGRLQTFGEDTKREFLMEIETVYEICEQKLNLKLAHLPAYHLATSFVSMLEQTDRELARANTSIKSVKLMMDLRGVSDDIYNDYVKKRKSKNNGWFGGLF